jgi:hypothetical protein
MWQTWLKGLVVTVIKISADEEFLQKVKDGYAADEFCKKITNRKSNMPGVRNEGRLWYINNHLLIPRVGGVLKQLFRLAHDCSGHFRMDKSYASLRECYYWLGMWCDLEESYILACQDCQQNKSQTGRPKGPLHPLPVLEK